MAFGKKTWLVIGAAAVVMGVVVAVVLAAGNDDDGDVATGTTETTTGTTGSTTTARGTTSTAGTGATSSSSCPEPRPDGDVLARADIDEDGTDELFVPAGAGGPRDVVGLLRIVDCEIVPVTLDGSPAEFAVGASVRLTGGVLCRGDGSIRVYAGESSDGETYAISWRDLRLDGSALTRAGEGSGTARAGGDLLTAASGLSCAS